MARRRRYSTFCALAGVDPTDHAAAAAGLPPIDSLDMWPLLSGANGTSPRTEVLVSSSCLVTAKWKVLTGRIAGASWPGEHYPNMTTETDQSWLSQYEQDCGKTGCLYDVSESKGDKTEHVDQASQQPQVLQAMLARLDTLSLGIWKRNMSDPLGTRDCLNCKSIAEEKYGGFYGPFCEIGSEPLPPTPGPYSPQPLQNCTYSPQTWVFPASRNRVNATTKEACCAACGMDPSCVASVLTCYPDPARLCDCNLKTWGEAQSLSHKTTPKHTTLTCLTGRKHIPGVGTIDG